MSKIGYVRVSAADQKTDRQEIVLKEYSVDKCFTEKASGKNTDRAQLKKMLEYVREGDTVYIESISRLARSTKDLLNIVQQLQEKSVDLVSLKENIDTTTPQGRFAFLLRFLEYPIVGIIFSISLSLEKMQRHLTKAFLEGSLPRSAAALRKPFV